MGMRDQQAEEKKKPPSKRTVELVLRGAMNKHGVRDESRYTPDILVLSQPEVYFEVS